MSIKVDKLTKQYGTQKALHEVSFEIGDNRIVGFLGPNGAGKSTTMKILAGLLPPTSGQAFVQNLNVQQQSLAVKKLLGFLPENNPLYRDMYVREILLFEANTHKLKEKKGRVEEVIRQTGLQAEQHKKVSQLSKGYKQRVGLAMCIIHQPQVLILDEPTSGLDPNQILEIRALIKELGKERTVLVSTHIMQEVEAICDEVIILNKGVLQDHFTLQDMPVKYPGKSLEDIFVSLTNGAV
ncbi:ATP-binding cassette domain-containing protein [Sphingobacterium wenxiniae]|uniref:ABC-2 type transport system ATP-binding protein n=1 Tax=Sphingobacterium wenxiniae TaxID=683125 RepID=A0A1I6TL09_9SPHI|nr:ATP-binding cassette domain-containing protein [Sphingobacterium wenxiniae]SFS89932.1 ABC-2 type transport system ATP-binding protein [Sphingobacterium wenxiniae]